jgi:hypothetical protein
MPRQKRRDVFVNCAFDAQFVPIFHAIVFAIVRTGFRARCAQETDDAGQNRFSKIQDIVAECRYGIHDISRTESDGVPALPRFNMPLELGIFLGAKRYGEAAQKQKRTLIFDVEQYRYQRFISDIAGQDIRAHGGEPARAIAHVVNWLRDQSKAANVPGGHVVATEYNEFIQALPAILLERRLAGEDMTFLDFVAIATAWVTEGK